MTPKRFRTLVLAHFKKHGRHDLPWRKTHDPYRILVSEIMLQQTQVERVVPFYNAFLKEFPTIQKLAAASLSSVLLRWQGLGYNRRAKMLHEAAKAVVQKHKGKMPSSIEELEQLPGVGHYTARAVAAFAYNKDVVFVETNLRTAVIYHFFSKEEKVSDRAITGILENALPKGDARTWYAALMDYGSSLKRSGVRVNAKSASYAKQASFKGSGREARGAILRALSKGAQIEGYLLGILGPDRTEQVRTRLETLTQEGLVQKKRTRYQLPT
jgi:A/G-specific adenine glycosylase